jgi:hypothetical protein
LLEQQQQIWMARLQLVTQQFPLALVYWTIKIKRALSTCIAIYDSNGVKIPRNWSLIFISNTTVIGWDVTQARECDNEE